MSQEANTKTDRDWISNKLNIGEEMLYLTQDEVIDLNIDREAILKMTKEALIEHGEKNYEMPAKIGVHPYDEVFYHAMPAYIPKKNAVGMKWVECYPSNPKKFNLPQTTGLLTVNDVESGVPIGLMDCAWITAMRTPAVTALTAEALHPNAETFGMFGSGKQGVEHVKFIGHTLKNLKQIYIYDVNEAAMDNLIKEVQPITDIEIIKAESAEQVARNCEVLSSATVILRDPLSIVKDEWISEGQTIIPCDLNTFWDPNITKRADKYLVDSKEEHELFSEMGYFPDGLPTIYGETGEVLSGNIKGRENKDQLIVCSNVGMAVCDIVVGREIFNKALENNRGTKLKL
ncbi:ornithine cyclodeaminase family protein [Staphylococcus kloosii]|jgi:ornithine cyclodeaminase/alanine dehydrogenase-like protein (mu-crystallin family)|uniref:ornithine cyclodeaminase family protein n=1 Tax=Staphylococcus kloosii TaxID=29384 RepID=UPI00189DE2D7|nr:ornithine cyclodeaminase family protein [Staphylococcus kloosii]MBF7025532.1 ornithine cyclodeaminase family protein [Staphylococcus kloosii]